MHLNIEFTSMPFFDQWGRHQKMKRVAEAWRVPFERKMRFKNLSFTVRKFRIFKNKSNRRIKNIFTLRESSLPGNIRLFDFHCSDDGFDIKRTSMFLLESEMLDLPKFQIKPKGFMKLLGELFFIDDKVFKDFPLFVQNYQVRGNDLDGIEYALKPELLEFLSDEKKWNIEGNGNYLLCYKKNKTQGPERLEIFKNECLEISRWILFSDSNDYVQ